MFTRKLHKIKWIKILSDSLGVIIQKFYFFTVIYLFDFELDDRPVLAGNFKINMLSFLLLVSHFLLNLQIALKKSTFWWMRAKNSMLWVITLRCVGFKSRRRRKKVVWLAGIGDLSEIWDNCRLKQHAYVKNVFMTHAKYCAIIETLNFLERFRSYKHVYGSFLNFSSI